MLYQSVRLSPRLEPLGQPEILFCRRCRGELAPVAEDPDQLRCTSCGTPRAQPRRWRPVEVAPELVLDPSALSVGVDPQSAFDWLRSVEHVAAALSGAVRELPVRIRISTAAIGIGVGLAAVMAATVH
ncbi:MAG: hypothetical protein M3R05_01045 [Chloroflexota bacterium]|nr:hypothetical protein [Chloroflexota bacterium]